MAFADPRARLEHILEAIREIEGFASGKTLQDYLSHGWLRFATQRGEIGLGRLVGPGARSALGTLAK